MQTILISQCLKPGVVFLLVLFLWLFTQLPIGRASTSHQTIPTAPPTSSVTPTITATETPTNTSQPTVTSTQTTYLLASQVPGTTASPTVETMLTPSEVPGSGTIPILTATLSPAEETQITATASFLLTATATPRIKLPGSSEILYCLLCGVILLIFVLGLIWFIRSRKRAT